jgi:hypothetical protein
MPGVRRPGRPWVFLSYTRDDQDKADVLRRDLDERDVGTISFEPGSDLVRAVDRALAQSDFFVLLWSRAAAGSEWVQAEYSAAFMRALHTQRSFLFVVRLDTTPLRPLLAPRYYLDAFDDWSGMVNTLVEVWHRDWALGVPVLPTPCPDRVPQDADERLRLHVRNRQLAVAHVVVVPAEATGKELERLVREQLALPREELNFNGAVGTRFAYQLTSAGVPVPADTTPLAQLPVEDGATIDLEVQVEWVVPAGPSPTVTYRGGPSSRSAPALKQFSAFAHLVPW